MIWLISYLLIAVTIAISVVQAILKGVWWVIVKIAEGILWLDRSFSPPKGF